MITFGDPVDLDTLRLRNEFLAKPGLTITLPQAARLLGVRLGHARAMLDALEREGFLAHNTDGEYRQAVIAFGRGLPQLGQHP